MNRILIGLLLFFAGSAFATEPCRWAGEYVKCYPSTGLFLNNGQSLSLGPDTDDTHYVELKANASTVSGYTLTFPPANGGSQQSLISDGTGGLSWYTPFTTATFTDYKTNLPMKNGAYAASTANIGSLVLNPGMVDGVDFTFGGKLLLLHQTDPTENGLWQVPAGDGAWTRETTMPDNAFTTLSAIVPVNHGGTLYGDTIWYSHSDGSGAVPFYQIPTTASNSPITASRALTTDASGFIAPSATTATELGYVSGVSSAIQTQLGNKQPLDSTLTALAAYNTNGVLTQTAADTFTGRTLTSGNGIAVTNGSGVAGNPTFAIDTSVVVDLSTAQSISNKTMTMKDGANTSIVNAADTTKKAQFDSSFISSATTRTFTFPDNSTTLVGTDIPQTLSAKTINGTFNTITNVSLTTGVNGTLPLANGGTNATTKAGAFDSLSPMSATGDMIYGGTSGTGTRLAAGTSNQILHSGSTPSWGAVDVNSAQVTGTLQPANGGTGITSLGTGIATFLGTPSSANLASALTDETGSGKSVFDTSPTISGATLSGTVTASGTIDVSTGTGIKLPTSGGTAATLNFYETATGQTVSLTGARSTTFTYNITRDGDVVTIRWSDDASSGTTCANAVFSGAAGSIPSRWRPGATVYYTIFVKDNGNNQATPGRLQFNSDGSMEIDKDFVTAFTGTSTCGYFAGSVSWKI